MSLLLDVCCDRIVGLGKKGKPLRLAARKKEISRFYLLYRSQSIFLPCVISDSLD